VPAPEAKALRVCFLAGTLGRGGAERQLVYMLRALDRAGVRMRVLCLTRGEPVEEEIRALNVPIEWVGRSGARPRRLYRIVRALRREPADIVQSVHFYTNLYAAMAGRLTGCREVGAIRNDLTNELRANGAMGWGHLRLSRHLIANSSLARERAIARGVAPEHIDFVRNVVEVGPANGRPDAVDGAPVRLLFAGRLVAQKRPERFLRVVAKLAAELPPERLRARIAGDGPLRPEMETLAGTLGLGPDRLEFLGERKDMDAVYGDADLLMLTSDYEGTPNVLLEAMAHGLPFVATRVGGVPEIAGADRGLVADADDEEGLVRAARQLLTDPQRRREMGRKGKAYVADHHSLEALGRSLIDIYGKVSSR
jgi:glycosyltransferase involved in cell wall biosynthesis